ncbi:plasminogen receptor (KT)-like [Daphnia pulicaria]|uniref:plasminogen receptor (KT)-like n=1 Tax=Daphnia pulicaria TaxID=35523 RepID=UPI001EE9B52A|nr:plasminogen receptor (KT)-like [Daphnia pulicaria]
MGGYVSKAVHENMKSNQEFMVEINRITIERQIQMQNQMRERMVALQIARTRELLNWFGAFYTVAAAGMLTGFHHSRKPGVLVPLLPLTFILGYQIDMAYGNKLMRIKHEAENIVKFESELLDLPMHLPTLSTIDMARQVQHDKLIMHSAEPPLYY